jgi:hypothetical protein
VKNLIEAKWTNFNTDDTDYPVLKGFVMHGFMPPPMPTKSSILFKESIQTKKEKEQQPPKRFTMKRFQNVRTLSNKHHILIFKFYFSCAGNRSPEHLNSQNRVTSYSSILAMLSYYLYTYTPRIGCRII